MIEDFSFKGKSAKSMGVIMSDPWLFAGPAWKYEEIEIEGRNGSVFLPMNLKDTSREITCTLLDPSKKDEVISWLSGEGEFSVKGRRTTGRIFDQIDFRRIGWDKETFTVPLLLSPLWYPADEGWAELTGSILGTECKNNGNYESYPIIKVEFTGGSHDNRVIFYFNVRHAGSVQTDTVQITIDNRTAVAGFEFDTCYIDTRTGDVTFDIDIGKLSPFKAVSLPDSFYPAPPGATWTHGGYNRSGSDTVTTYLMNRSTFTG